MVNWYLRYVGIDIFLSQPALTVIQLSQLKNDYSRRLYGKFCFCCRTGEIVYVINTVKENVYGKRI